MNTTKASKLKTSLTLPVQSAAPSCFLSALGGNKLNSSHPSSSNFCLAGRRASGRGVGAARKQRTQEPKFRAVGMWWPSVPYGAALPPRGRHKVLNKQFVFCKHFCYPEGFYRKSFVAALMPFHSHECKYRKKHFLLAEAQL